MMKHFQPPYHLLSFPSSPLNTHTNLPFFSLLPSTVIMFPGPMHQKLSPILPKTLQHDALNTIFCQALAVSFASHESIENLHLCPGQLRHWTSESSNFLRAIENC